MENQTYTDTVLMDAERHMHQSKRINPRLIEDILGLEGGLIMPVTATEQHEQPPHARTGTFDNLQLRYWIEPYSDIRYFITLSLCGYVTLERRGCIGEERWDESWTFRSGMMLPLNHVSLGLSSWAYQGAVVKLAESYVGITNFDGTSSKYSLQEDDLKVFKRLEKELNPLLRKIKDKEKEIVCSL